jgi:hypothetical protein
LAEQQKLLRQVLQLLKGYEFIVIGDREFHSVVLTKWLDEKSVSFAFRQKQNAYIQTGKQDYQRLDSLGLAPGTGQTHLIFEGSIWIPRS